MKTAAKIIIIQMGLLSAIGVIGDENKKSKYFFQFVITKKIQLMSRVTITTLMG